MPKAPTPVKIKGGTAGAPALRKLKMPKIGKKPPKPKFTYG
jgi:hypothetical protein